MNEEPTCDNVLIHEANGTKFLFVPLTMFHDLTASERLSQLGIIDNLTTKSVYKVVDEKKFMLAKIKYGI